MISVMFFKELKELLRDRKHLLVTILLPIFITPLMMFGVGALQVNAQQEKDRQVLHYTLIENAVLPGLITKLQENPLFDNITDSLDESTQEAFANETLDFAIQVSRDGAQYLVTIDYKETALGAKKIRRLTAILDSINKALVAEKLLHYGVNSSDVDYFLNPVQISDNNIATAQENIGQALGSFLPFLIIIWMISSAIAISSDLVAGEKERGTLETLIISPVSLLAMVTGKWMAITLASWFAGMLTLVSLWLSTQLLALFADSDGLLELLTVLSPASVALGIVIMLPTAGLVSAVFLVSGSYAQSFKEAQSYASGLMMLFFIPLFATISGAVELSVATSLIPIMNTGLAFTEMLQGSLSVGYVIPMFISNSLVIFAVLTFAVALYRSERVLSRQ